MTVHSFDTKVAQKVGLNAAIIYQHIVFWVTKNAANDERDKHFHEGKWWTYQSIRGLGLLFPYMTENQIRRAVEKLEEVGFIGTGNFNETAYDRTKWFCVLRQIDLASMPNGFGENAEPIPDRNPDKIPDIDPPNPQRGDLFASQQDPEAEEAEKPVDDPRTDPFDEFWEIYPRAPRKTDRPKARAAFRSIVLGKHKSIERVPAETIIAGLRRYAETGPDPQFVPLPTTWLNGARWEQHPPPARRVEQERFWEERVR